MQLAATCHWTLSCGSGLHRLLLGAGLPGSAVGHGGGKKVARPEAVLGTLRSLTGGSIVVVGSGETPVQIQ